MWHGSGISVLAHFQNDLVVFVVIFFLLIPLSWPLFHFSWAAVVWRRRGYWRKRWWWLAIFYVLLLVSIGMILITAAPQSQLEMWWGGVMVGGGIFWLPPRRPRYDPAARPCPVCSYDLRAHRLDQACPECGTVSGRGTKVRN